MGNPSFLQETKQHGAVRFPFNIYPCTIPGDFPQVALHWQDSMELVFVKRGSGLVQMGTAAYPAHTGDIFVFSPGTLHALRQKEGCSMEYENIIFDLELLGGAGDLCAEKYLLPLQSGRLSLTQRLTPDEPCYARAAACLRETEDVNRAKEPGYELFIKGALLRFLAKIADVFLHPFDGFGVVLGYGFQQLIVIIVVFQKFDFFIGQIFIKNETKDKVFVLTGLDFGAHLVSRSPNLLRKLLFVHRSSSFCFRKYPFLGKA